MLLCIDGQFCVAAAEWQPGLASGEAGLRCRGAPRHRRARPVASECQRPVGDGLRVAQLLEAYLRLRQSQFLALVEENVASQAQQQQQREPRAGRSLLGRRPARHRAWRVVVGKGPARPTSAWRLRPRVHGPAYQCGAQPVCVKEIEAVGGVQAPRPLSVGRHVRLGALAADLSHREPSPVLFGQRTDALEERDHLRLRLVVQGLLEVRGASPLPPARQRRRVVAELAVVHREVDGIEAEAVHPAVEPEPHALEQRVLNCGVVHVQVGLLGQEVVHEVLAAAGVPGPRRAAEQRLPVVRWGAVGTGVGPHVPVAAGIVAARAALLEPGMLVRSVREHLVDDDAQAELVRTRQQPVEVRKGAEDRIDVAIVADVVAEVLHRGGEEGREPDRVDAERGDVLEVRSDPGQVSDTVVIRVGEAARVDLVDHRAAPPRRRRQIRQPCALGAQAPASASQMTYPSSGTRTR